MDLRENLMLKGAMKLARDCAGVTPDDKVAVVCDYVSFEVANQVAKSCLALGACTNMIIFEPTKSHGTPPPEMVGAAMEKATVAFLCTTKSMSHAPCVKAARAVGCRIVTMPEVFPHMLISGAIEADFLAQSVIAGKVRDMLTAAKTARIVCTANGTDMSFVLEGRTGRAVDGIANTPGSFAAPPNIESCLAPVENKTNGVYVVNASIAGVGVIVNPVTITVKDGTIISIEGEGEDAKKLKEILSRSGDPNCFKICELGIGLNPCAIPCGSLLEDEAPLGTVHMAAGSNASNFPGGQITAPVHIDMVSNDMTLYIDDVAILIDGDFQYDALN